MKFLLFILTAIFLTGCSSLLVSKDNVHYFYVLNPVGEVIEIKKPADIQLYVHEPTIPEWLDVQHIILRRGNNQVDFYAEARWAADAGNMVQELVVQSLEANHVAADINSTRTSRQPDYQLNIEVFAMQAEYENSEDPPQVRVGLQGKLIAYPSEKVTYQFTVENVTEARHNNLTSIVKAFDSSMQACLTEIVKRTARGLALAPSPVADQGAE